LKQIVIKSIALVLLLIICIIAAHSTGVLLFVNIPALMAIFVILGLAAGLITAAIYRFSPLPAIAGKPRRHTLDAFAHHWGNTVGILFLFGSGLSLKIDPDLISSNIHFIGVLLVLAFGSYFLTHFLVFRKYGELLPDLKDIIEGTLKKYLVRAPWKDTGKYLASQRAAFLAFAVIGCDVLVSGLIKAAGLAADLPDHLIRAVTLVHDISGLLLAVLTIVHVVMVLTRREERQLLTGWFKEEADIRSNSNKK
jgi:thiosulfate reductase cytochrome b subunit